MLLPGFGSVRGNGLRGFFPPARSRRLTPVFNITSTRPEGAAIGGLNSDEWFHVVTIDGVPLRNLVVGTRLPCDDHKTFLAAFNDENGHKLIGDKVFTQRTSNRATGSFRMICPCGRIHTKPASNPNNPNNPDNPDNPSNPDPEQVPPQSRLGMRSHLPRQKKKKRKRRSQRVGCPFFIQFRFGFGYVELRGRCLTHRYHPESNEVTERFKTLTSEQRDALASEAIEKNWDRKAVKSAAERVAEGSLIHRIQNIHFVHHQLHSYDRSCQK